MGPVSYHVQGEGEIWGTGVSPARETSTVAVIHLTVVQLQPCTERLLYTMLHCAGRCASPGAVFPDGWGRLLAPRGLTVSHGAGGLWGASPLETAPPPSHPGVRLCLPQPRPDAESCILSLETHLGTEVWSCSVRLLTPQGRNTWAA